MANFSQLSTFPKADGVLRAATPKWLAVNLAYAKGDHLQNGTQWIGPQPPPTMFAKAIAMLRRIWVPVPTIEEMLDGHAAGAVGREPAFECVLSQVLAEDEEYAPADEEERDLINAQIGAWFDRRETHGILRDWVMKMRLGERGVLRLFVPPDSIDDNGDLKMDVSDVEDALDCIFIECPTIEAATVHLDRSSMREAGLYRYQVKDDRNTPKKRIEMVFVALDNEVTEHNAIQKGQTVIRTLEGEKVLQEIAFDCGGYSLMFEGHTPLLITEPVKANQRAANMINTMLPLNAAYAGFRKTDYFDVKRPVDEKTNKPKEVVTGPAQAMYWYSQPYTDPTTKEVKHFPPQLIVTEPVPTDSLRADIDHFDRLIRRTCKQEHSLFIGGSNVSAVALIQMRTRFANDLLLTTPQVEAALRWLQGALYCFALYLCGKESEIEAFLEKYRTTSRCKPYTGPLTPEEITVLIQLYQAGLIPQETAMVLFGVEDVDAEISKLRDNPEVQAKLDQGAVDLLTAWSQLVELEDAIELVPLRDPVRAKLEKILARKRTKMPANVPPEDEPTANN